MAGDMDNNNLRDMQQASNACCGLFLCTVVTAWAPSCCHWYLPLLLYIIASHCGLSERGCSVCCNLVVSLLLFGATSYCCSLYS
jgi:hypothetical protein